MRDNQGTMMTTNIKGKKVILVGGTVRSGTTILNLVLANDPGGMALGEVEHLFFPYTREHYEKIAELSRDTRWRQILDDGERALYRNVFQLFPEVQTIIDSSKNPFWYAKQMASNRALDIRNVIIYKHPLDLRHSIQKRGDANWEKIFTHYHRRYFSLIDDFRSISLHSLLESPEQRTKLFNYLGLQDFPGKLEYWNRQHVNFFGSTTVKKKAIEGGGIIRDDEHAQRGQELRTVASDPDAVEVILDQLRRKDIGQDSSSRPERLQHYGGLELQFVRLKSVFPLLKKRLEYKLERYREMILS